MFRRSAARAALRRSSSTGFSLCPKAESAKGCLMEERVMSLTSQQKRGLFWALGILIMATLASVAWAQINTTLAHCFSLF